MKKLILCCSLLIAAVTIAQGQIMLRGGVNYSDISIDSQVDNEVFDRKPGFHLGLNANVPLGPLFSIRPAALYQFKGAEVQSGGVTQNADLSYIEVPVNLGLHLGPIVLEAGPYFGYLLNTSDGLFNDDNIEKSDWGANFGAVVELDKLGIGANYSNSLSNIAKGDRWDQATELSNGNLSIFLYYKL